MKVSEPQILNRQVVKSEYATITVPEINLEIPPNTQKGSIKTIEGFLSVTYDGLMQTAADQAAYNADFGKQIQGFCDKLKELKNGQKVFTFIIDDPSGNSFIESSYQISQDSCLKVHRYHRSPAQTEALGLAVTQDQTNTENQAHIDGDITNMINHTPQHIPDQPLRAIQENEESDPMEASDLNKSLNYTENQNEMQAQGDKMGGNITGSKDLQNIVQGGGIGSGNMSFAATNIQEEKYGDLKQRKDEIQMEMGIDKDDLLQRKQLLQEELESVNQKLYHYNLGRQQQKPQHQQPQILLQQQQPQEKAQNQGSPQDQQHLVQQGQDTNQVTQNQQQYTSQQQIDPQQHNLVQQQYQQQQQEQDQKRQKVSDFVNDFTPTLDSEELRGPHHGQVARGLKGNFQNHGQSFKDNNKLKDSSSQKDGSRQKEGNSLVDGSSVKEQEKLQSLAQINGANKSMFDKINVPEEVVVLPGSCYACGAECDTRMFQTSIPHFKEILIMSNSCEVCGYKNSEIKSGGGISKLGRRIKVSVRGPEDLQRDVIRAESASISIPEADFYYGDNDSYEGGMVTTIEGLLETLVGKLKRTATFYLGDSNKDENSKSKWQAFFDLMSAYSNGEKNFTLILEDPLANSFISSSYEDPKEDKNMIIEEFERSLEVEEQLGITQLKQLEKEEAQIQQQQEQKQQLQQIQ